VKHLGRLRLLRTPPQDGRFEGEAQHALENALEQIITLKQLQ
jgi:hypothetical protein